MKQKTKRTMLWSGAVLLLVVLLCTTCIYTSLGNRISHIVKGDLTQDEVMALVDRTESERMNKDERADVKKNSFAITASKIHGYYQEEDKLKVLVTTYSASYYIEKSALMDDGMGIVPAAITYKKDKKGNFILADYQIPEDGSAYTLSIEKFCVLPVSKTKIIGVADRIIAYTDPTDLKQIQKDRLITYLKANNLKGITYTEYEGAQTEQLT